MGGGIRSVAKAHKLLDAGACKVVIGTAASVEFLREIPLDRVVVALDAVNDDVLSHGWTQTTS